MVDVMKEPACVVWRDLKDEWQMNASEFRQDVSKLLKKRTVGDEGRKGRKSRPSRGGW
jgi:hypothetical protein